MSSSEQECEFDKQHYTQVDVLIYALLDATNDQKSEVKQAVATSLHKLGNKKPNLMLDISFKYLQKNVKLPHSHRAIILNAMAEVCKAQLKLIDNKLAIEIINLCVGEIVSVKDVIPEWQSAASGVLVALGHQFCYEVMESLLPKFQPGVVPHFFIMQTLGDLAVANAFVMIPFLKAVLQTTLTIVALVKHDNMKWVIAHALARFSEAIIDYLANIDKSPDQTVRKQVFSTELSVAYGTLFYSWFQSKELKIRVAVVGAIGYLSQLLSKEKLEEELPRLIPGMLNMYKRHSDPYFISQALSMILETAVENSCTSLDALIDSIISTLFPQTFSIPDYSQPSAVKNHNEVLRCFAIIGKVHSDHLILYLLQRLDNSNDRVRIGSLTVLRHLINSLESRMSDKMATIVNGLKIALSENNNKVKKVLAQVIVALAHHGYLELEGSQQMTEFIIQQCALDDDTPELISRRQMESDNVTNAELRSMCENILHLLTTTVERVNTVFWPHILKFLMSEKLTNAIGIVCKCATNLGSKKKQEQAEDFEIDFEKHDSLPRPVQLVARLIVMLGHPKTGSDRGVSILKLMQILIPSIEKNLASTWDATIPNLLQYLESSSSWSQVEWENMVLKLLTDSISEVDRQDWSFQLGKVLGEQIQLYYRYPEDKNFLFKCLGMVMKRCNGKSFINDLLDLIFKNVNHSVSTDREGCAHAVGHCAGTHMDIVLVKLDHLARVDLAKRSGLLGFILDIKNDADQDNWKSTIVLCYGYVSRFAPAALLTARIESPILRNVISYFSSAKESTIRLSLIKMTEMIAISLHPMNLKERYSFRSKGELLKNMAIFVLTEKGAPLRNPTVSLAIDACSALLKLDPVLHCDERLQLLKTCYETVFPLPPVSAPDRAKVENYEEEEEHEKLLETTLRSLVEMLKELLLKDISFVNFYSLFVSLEGWLISSRSVERERAIQCVLILSKCFLDNLTVVLGGSFSFENHGAIIARMVPRCTDSSTTVREHALSVIYNILKIVSRHDGFSADHVDQDIELLQQLKQRVLQDNPDILYDVSVDLAKLLSNKLSAIQLRQFLDVVMEGLIDSQAHSSSGTCVVLNHVLKNKSSVLQQELEMLITLLHNRLAEITCVQTRRGTLQIIRTLASFQLNAVLNCLLSYSLPFDDNVVDWWSTLGSDPHLSGSVIEQFCEVILRNSPYVEYPDPRNKKEIIRIATPKVLAIISAMKVMFGLDEMEKTALKEYPRLFTILLSMVGCFSNVYPPSVIKESPKDPNAKPMIVIHSNKANQLIPSRVAVEAFKAFLTCTKSTLVSKDVGNVWETLDKSSSNPDVIACFAKLIATNYPQYLPGVVTCFNPLLSSSFDSQRIVAVAFFAELIVHHRLLDQTALELLLNSMLGRLVDSSREVRRLAIRGLGSIGKLDVEHMDSLEWFGVYKYSNTVLSAMMSGLDDKDDPHGEIALEAMKGLCKVLEDMDESHVESALINIVMRLRPSFESLNADIRVASYKLLGVLARFCKGPVESAFIDQLHGNLVSLLLHLNDEDKSVIKSCKSALRAVGPYLGSEAVNAMFQKHLIDDSQLYYREFIGDLSKIMVADFSDRVSLYLATCVSYFKSSWSIIRSNAAMFAGFLLGLIPVEMRATIANDGTFGAMTKLLRDSSPEVRVKVAEAISQLHSY